MNVPIEIDANQPTFPSNVILKGQTLRVQGSGFNAIEGNPLSTDPNANCALGSDDVSANNCCRKTAKANVCDSATPPGPLPQRGNCVALSNWGGNWAPLAVTSVTPTTIVTEIPSPWSPIWGCIGERNEKVRVSKMRSGGPFFREGSYCLNTAAL